MPVYRIDKMLFFCKTSYCLCSAFRKRTRSSIVVIPLFGTTYSPYITMYPVKTIIPVSINTIYISTGSNFKIKYPILVIISFIFTISYIPTIHYNLQTFRIISWNKPHFQFIQPKVVRIDHSIFHNIMDHVHCDLNTKHFFCMTLSRIHHCRFIFINCNVVRKLYCIDRNWILIRICTKSSSNLLYHYNIGMICL